MTSTTLGGSTGSPERIVYINKLTGSKSKSQMKLDQKSMSTRLPRDPGVYLMKDAEGKIIYIGKAKNLNKRVSSYFIVRYGNDDSRSWKTSRLVNKISDIEFIVTDNEIEAFLLESNLIKRYRPLFNIELKDQQRYTYLKITDEPYPRLLVSRRNRNGEFLGPRGKIYGPFVRGSSKFLTVGLLRKLFKIRTCGKLPKSPCLQYFIKNCDAPCIKNITRGQYTNSVASLQNILEGKSSIEKFVTELESEMKRESQLQNYERAKEIRDTLDRLNNLRIRQKMEKVVARNPDEEYVGIVNDFPKGMAHIMTLRRTRGVISDRKKFEFDLIGDNSLETFLLQYYSTAAEIPRFVYVNQKPDSIEALEISLELLAGHKVSIVKISEDFHEKEKRRLMELVTRNLALYIEKGYNPDVIELKNSLNLPSIPLIIDCIDISNLGTSFAAGACVRFVDGKPSKTGYRKFKIKSIWGQNDFAMISEVVSRRYSNLNSNSSNHDDDINSKSPFASNQPPADDDRLPNLIVIDGGKGQLNAALASLLRVGLTGVCCIALAKEKEEIYLPRSSIPVVLPMKTPASNILRHIRDEAHRFGLAYNIHLRKVT